MRIAGLLFARVARFVSLLLLATLGTIALVRFAPGYFADGREMDAQYANEARAALRVQQDQQGSVVTLTQSLLNGWLRRDLGRSRQYDVPVSELIKSRVWVTAKLLMCGVGCGWLLAFTIALPLSARRGSSGEVLIAGPTAVVLAIPLGAMATTCLLTNIGGPILVLTSLIGVRDFKFVYRLLRQTWKSPHLLHARAQGIASHRITWIHLLPTLGTELFALSAMSFVIALSAIVPVEVVFNVPGLGQLAWSAAMNRDLPVLLAVTLLMAMCIGIVSMFAEPARRLETVQCG